MAVRPPANTPAAAAAPAAAEPITAESLGWQLRAALPSLRLHSVSLYDQQANVLWLSEGALGPDEHNLVLEAMEALGNDRSQSCFENGLEDGRVAIFIPVRAPQGDLVGVAMILADMKSVSDGVLEKMVSPQVRTIMQKIAVLLRANTKPGNGEAPAPIPVNVASVLELTPERAARNATPAPRAATSQPAAASAAAAANTAGKPAAVVAAAAAKSDVGTELSPQAVDDILEFELFPDVASAAPVAPAPAPASNFEPMASLSWDSTDADVEFAATGAQNSSTIPAGVQAPTVNAAASVGSQAPGVGAPAFAGTLDNPFATAAAVTAPAGVAIPAVESSAGIAAPAAGANNSTGNDPLSTTAVSLALPSNAASTAASVAATSTVSAAASQSATASQGAAATQTATASQTTAANQTTAAGQTAVGGQAAAAGQAAIAGGVSTAGRTASAGAPAMASSKSTNATTTTKALSSTGTARALNGAATTTGTVPTLNATGTSRTLAFDPSNLILDVQPFSKLRAGGRMRRYEVLPRIPNRDNNRAPAAMDGLALQRLLSWLGSNRAAWNLEPTSFSLNLSISTLEDPRFPQHVASCLKTNGIAPDNLGFEIAEALCTQHRAQVERFISLCDKLGCFVVIDDFSFDSAVLPLLRSKALRLVKIDPKLTSAALRDKLSQAMVVAIVQAVKVLGIHCAAKRVESQASLQWLTAIGCDLAQGPALSQVLPIESLNMPQISATAEPGKAS